MRHLLKNDVDVLNTELHEEFDKMLDGLYGSVVVFGKVYLTSEALRVLDNDRYESEFGDWLTEGSDSYIRGTI